MPEHPTYEETYAWLVEQLPMYQRLGPPAYKEGLDRIKALCQALGQPQERMGLVIHVAGTNGKGSVCHAIASVLQSCGYKTGLFTSPHLLDFRERIRINGQCISRSDVVKGVHALRQTASSLDPSFFEFTTALAFQHFANHGVDFAVIETGMGGRLDSTNLVKPTLCAITHIDWDHMNFLGDRLPLIAAEKAGIFKRGVPVVIGRSQDEEVNQVFVNKAHELRCLITFADKVYQLEIQESKENILESVWKVHRLGLSVEPDLVSDLQGHYQAENLGQVLAMVDALRNIGIVLDQDRVLEGLRNIVRNTGMRGRWQVVGQHPLRVLDVAHNTEGIHRVIRQALSCTASSKWSVVLGISADKDLGTILSFFPQDARYYFAAPNNPRCLPAEVLAQRAQEYGLTGQAYPSVQEAWQEAVRGAHPQGLVLALGSFFVIAEIPDGLQPDHGLG
ncbi:MAG: bifunctional folylpolyglutamate synthase/dihydrofolate synthase [Bacteroidota bacterium]